MLRTSDLNSKSDPNNYYSTFVQGQKIATVSSFTFESGAALQQVPVAYSTWGALNPNRDNVLVVCHALTGSSDAMDWWRPLFGPGKALDSTRYFIFCANVLGSPYGTASPLSTNPSTGRPYGPTFPQSTVKDDVRYSAHKLSNRSQRLTLDRLHKQVLDALGVQSVAAVIGGSMGGMTNLEWALSTPPGYVKNIVPIATSAYQGAWGISWSETQRRAIYADPVFKSGYYDPVPVGQPQSGLGTARMIAMLTYRSHSSFEARFGRKLAASKKKILAPSIGVLPSPPSNDAESDTESVEDEPVKYSAQGYLDYQADKFLTRFDTNCYIHLTKKMDAHDITRGRVHTHNPTPTQDDLQTVLSKAPPKALVIGVESDVLFPISQQIELARHLPESKFLALKSGDGHDGFLLEFDTLNKVIKEHLQDVHPWVYEGPPNAEGEKEGAEHGVVNSVFGEAEGVEF